MAGLFICTPKHSKTHRELARLRASHAVHGAPRQVVMPLVRRGTERASSDYPCATEKNDSIESQRSGPNPLNRADGLLRIADRRIEPNVSLAWLQLQAANRTRRRQPIHTRLKGVT